jgi:DNA-binding MarR family transcriptional regulator
MSTRERIIGSLSLSHKEALILRTLMTYSLVNKRITVSDLLAMREIGSPATIHSFLKKLIQSNFITTELEKKDNRIKYLSPSTKTIKLFSKLTDTFILSKDKEEIH